MRRVVLPLLLALVLATPEVRAQDTAAQDAAPTVFVLVRHAEKQTGDDPALTAEGQARAEALRDALVDAGVQYVVASQYRRAIDTARPLADTLGLDVEVRPLGDPAAVIRQLAADYRGRTVLVAGHSNTIPAMVGALLGTAMAEWDERDYDNLMIVTVDADGSARLIRAKYGTADPVP